MPHTFFVYKDDYTVTNPGTAWIFYAGNYGQWPLDYAPGAPLTAGAHKCRLVVQADMTLQDTAYMAVAGGAMNPAIDTDKAAIVTLTGGAVGRFVSAEEDFPGGLPNQRLTLVVKSSTVTGDILLQSAFLMVY